MWGSEHPANSLGAFTAAAACGFGTELDIRDHRGSVVSALADAGRRLPIAINVKVDGLGGVTPIVLCEVHRLGRQFLEESTVWRVM